MPWAEPQSWFTHAFEQMVGYLAQNASKTVVSMLMRVAWATVGAIIGRVVHRSLPLDRLDGLKRIGIDLLSYRKQHKYVTVVVDHDTGRVVWARQGKNADTLQTFFAELGKERCDALEAITIDMSAAYIAAVKECAPNATLIFDRFHLRAFSGGSVLTPKSGHERVVPLANELRTILVEATHAKLPRGRLVLNERGHAPTRQNVLTSLRRLQERNGLRVRSFHSLRHSFCSTLIRRGASVEAVRLLAGHSDLATTQRYVHAEAADLAGAIAKLG